MTTFQKITRDEPRSFDSFEVGDGAPLRAARPEPTGRHAEGVGARPDLLAKYRQEGEEIAKAHAEAAAPRPVSKAVADFDDIVSEIAKRDGCPRHVAMERARVRYPALFKAYRQA